MKLKNDVKNQKGVTLLLAIVLLAAMLSISFSIATILFIEIRVSGDLTKTEASLYAANGVSEQEIFNLKRSVCTGSGTCPVPLSQFDNGTVLRGEPKISSTSPSTLILKLAVGSTKILNFCNAAASTVGCGYGSVTVQNLTQSSASNASIDAYLCQWNAAYDSSVDYGDNGPCYVEKDTNGSLLNTYGYWLDPTQGGTTYQVTLTSSANTMAQWANLDNNYQQELVLVNNGSAPAYVSVSTYDPNGVPLGLPYVGSTSVTVDTINASVGRRVQVIVPESADPNPASTFNLALASNGSTAFGDPEYSNLPYFDYPVTNINNGGRSAFPLDPYYGNYYTSSESPPSDSYPVGTVSHIIVGVNFKTPQTIQEVDVFTLSNNFLADTIITKTTPANNHGIEDYNVQYTTNGTTWANIPGGTVAGNNLAWNKFNFSAIDNVTAVRLYITKTHDTHALVNELEVY